MGATPSSPSTMPSATSFYCVQLFNALLPTMMPIRIGFWLRLCTCVSGFSVGLVQRDLKRNWQQSARSWWCMHHSTDFPYIHICLGWALPANAIKFYFLSILTLMFFVIQTKNSLKFMRMCARLAHIFHPMCVCKYSKWSAHREKNKTKTICRPKWKFETRKSCEIHPRIQWIIFHK